MITINNLRTSILTLPFALFLLVANSQAWAMTLHLSATENNLIVTLENQEREVLYIRNNLRFGNSPLWHSLSWEVRDSRNNRLFDNSLSNYGPGFDFGYRDLQPGDKVQASYLLRNLVRLHGILTAGSYTVKATYADHIGKHKQAFQERIKSNKLSVQITQDMIADVLKEASGRGIVQSGQ